MRLRCCLHKKERRLGGSSPCFEIDFFLLAIKHFQVSALELRRSLVLSLSLFSFSFGPGRLCCALSRCAVEPQMTLLWRQQRQGAVREEEEEWEEKEGEQKEQRGLAASLQSLSNLF